MENGLVFVRPSDELVWDIMQVDGLWISVALGAGLGVLYIAVSFMSNQRALRSTRNAMLIVVGAMLVRLFTALALLIAILLLLPIARTAFMGSFFVMFVVGLVAEIWFLLNGEASASQPEV